MHLIVKHKSHPTKELRFRDGPVYIGRQLGSQIFLPDKTISRQHAVIYSTTSGQWMLEDLDSANKTYLNGKAIHKEPLSDGDIFTVSGFEIEVRLREIASMPAKINMEETLLASTEELRIIKRKITNTNGPVFKLSQQNIKNYAQTTCKIDQARSADELMDMLIAVVKKQLSTFRVWIGFKKTDAETFVKSKGRIITGQSVRLDSISLKDNIMESAQNCQFSLISRFGIKIKQKDRIRSAIIAPVLHQDRCLGVIYIDNSLDHEQYDIMDLNYLILLSISVGNVLSRTGI